MRLLCGSCRRRERAFPPPALPASLQATTALPAEGFILELDLEASSVVEVTRSPGLQSLLQPGTAQLSLQEATGALRAAGGDPRVKGLLALLGGQTGMGLAQVQELRDAVADFRQVPRSCSLCRLAWLAARAALLGLCRPAVSHLSCALVCMAGRQPRAVRPQSPMPTPLGRAVPAAPPLSTLPLPLTWWRCSPGAWCR